MSLISDPLWYKDSVIYQIHIKSFFDSNNDGIGDFRGLIKKLDYIQSLGVNVIWLLPFYLSPLKDDGYDTADYYNINPDYGTIKDFKLLLKEAHSRNLRVITELVLNHTSDQHMWFQRARKSPKGSNYRNFYVWSETPDKYKDARIIFQDFEQSNWTYDNVAKAYYWHRFYYHQPDLNFDNPNVHKELLKVVDFWFTLGVDGLRLDAVPYLYEREGTNCENLPETHAFLKNLNTHIQANFKDKMLLAEANQWPEDVVVYFGNGDETQMAFHFPIMPRLYMSVQMENRFPIVDIIEQTPSIPDNCQWAMFLRNHDELTLEMVTDEERDFMYRSFVKESRARINLGIRRRLAPLTENNKRKIELLNILLFSFPGTPIIYYGDELGMGDNFYLGDRDGVRTPMQWSPDRNAGFSDVNPQKLILPVVIDPEYHYESINVEVQQKSTSSLLRWMKTTINLRKTVKAFGRGSIEFLAPDNPRVLAFTRKYNDEIILVVANLSRFSQAVELPLSNYKDYNVRELFSRNKFPQITDRLYQLTLSPYDYYWFRLELNKSPHSFVVYEPLEIKLDTSKADLFENNMLTLENTLGLFLLSSIKNAENVQSINVEDYIPVSKYTYLTFINVIFVDSSIEKMVFTLGLTKDVKTIENKNIIAKFITNDSTIYLVNALYIDDLRNEFVLNLLSKKIHHGSLTEMNLNFLFNHRRHIIKDIQSRIISVKNEHFVIDINGSYVLKIFNYPDEGLSPEVEILKLFQSAHEFNNELRIYADILFKQNSKFFTYGVVLNNLPYQGDAWTYFLESIAAYLEKSLSDIPGLTSSYTTSSFFDNNEKLFNSNFYYSNIEQIQFELAAILGKNIASMHNALSKSSDTLLFRPVDFSMLYQRSVYQGILSNLKKVFRHLSKLKPDDPDTAGAIHEIMNRRDQFINFLDNFISHKIKSKKIRIHGNLHLGQIVFTGKDFIITNYEGNTSIPSTERKLKRCSLRDVASLLWSLHFAANYSLLKFNLNNETEKTVIHQAADQWKFYIGNALIKSYLENLNSGIIPDDIAEMEYLMNFYLLDKTLIEAAYIIDAKQEYLPFVLRGLKYFFQFFKS